MTITTNATQPSLAALPLKSKRITLRDWALEDIEQERFWQQPHHQWHETNGPYYPLQTSAEIDERLSVLESKILSHNFQTVRTRLPIIDLSSDAVIGCVSSYWESIETNWLCIGIMIYDPKHWNKGIGQEALTLWCDYLFASELNLARLDIRTWSGNLGMMRLAEKLGFTKEAVFRKARIVKGEYYDSIGYGILREEWLRAD